MNTLKWKDIIWGIFIFIIVVIVGLTGIWIMKSKETSVSPERNDPSEPCITCIEIQNLNDEHNAVVELSLGNGWIARKVTGAWSEHMKDKLADNLSLASILNERTEYYIYDENEKEVGWFGITERLYDTDESCFPSQYQSKEMCYEGPTKLGEGTIYLIRLGDGHENADQKMEYHAIIPINDETLTYNFILRISEGENEEDTLDVLKDILILSENVSKQIDSLFRKDDTSPENKEQIFYLLQFFNWSKYAEENSEGFSNLTRWLSGLKISNIDDMSNILNATNGLYDQQMEVYCLMLKDLFFNNQDTFIKALCGLDDDQIRLVISYVQSACDQEEVIEIVECLLAILYSESLSVAEREVLELYFLESCQIELSGRLTTEIFYGPPNYGENPETDEKEYPYVLMLDKPIKSGELEVTMMQVVPHNTHSVQNSLNKHVKVEGTLFFAITGHHHTPILINMDTFSVVKE
ncbi:MAG: DUF4431 domain-containing protein [Clostridiales bacterium]|nr:DUF4431 domain-containing protein [Clostridiales bacterium]